MRRYTTYQPHKEEALPLPEGLLLSREYDKSRRWLTWLKRSIFVLLALVIVLISLAGWYTYRLAGETTKLFGGTPLGNLAKAFQATDLTGASANHVNILITGNSVDDPGHAGANLTDSIMVLSVNTANHTAVLLSIPRDLWVEIPGYGHGRINFAYAYGQTSDFNENGLPAGGIGLLEKIITTELNIPVNYYMLLNYSAVREIVNAVGGVDVNIQSSDSRGLFDPNIAVADGGPLQLTNGEHHLDGQTALNLIRARGDPCGCGQYAYGFPRSDFDRTEHQRQVFVALEPKVASKTVLLNPAKLDQIMSALAPNLQTDMKINEARRFVQIMMGIKNSNIAVKSMAGDNQSLVRDSTIAGQSVQIPSAGLDDYAQIDSYLQQLGFELNQ